MALVPCPSCNKKISDKVQSCQHCGFTLAQANADDLERKQKLQKYLKAQKIQTQSMVAMLMFVTGFGFMFWGEALPGDMQHNIAAGTSVVGFVWYIINRIRLIFVKKSD
jgi:hypothetical protein